MSSNENQVKIPAEDDNNQSIESSPSSASKKDKRPWTDEEDEALMLAVLADKKNRDERNDDQSEGEAQSEDDEEDWETISRAIPGRTPVQCLQRYMRHLTQKPVKDEDSSDATVFFTADTETEGKGTEANSLSTAGEKRRLEVVESKASAGRRVKVTVTTKKLKLPEKSSPLKWSTEEISLLKKLVEQYQDSK